MALMIHELEDFLHLMRAINLVSKLTYCSANILIFSTGISNKTMDTILRNVIMFTLCLFGCLNKFHFATSLNIEE